MSDYDKIFEKISGGGVDAATEESPYDDAWSRVSPQAQTPAPVVAVPSSKRPSKTEQLSMKEVLAPAMNYDPTDSIAGFLRGTGSIGATLLTPIDALARSMGVSNSWIGRDDRRAAMDGGFRELGADPTSTQFKTNKLLGEAATTSGAGKAIAAGVRMIPGASAALPTLLPAIESGGFLANNTKGVYGMANRVAGGAVSGGALAGLVDPKDAKTGMMIGGAFPMVVKSAGMAGDTMSQAWKRNFPSSPINPVLKQTLKESIEAGYVVPPNMVNPSLKNQVVESISGKQATQQVASTKNTQVTEKLVRQALGIADDVPLSQSTLENLRKTAGKAYSEVSNLSPQAAADLEALKVARNEAQGWFKAYNRSARPDDLALAKQFRAQAEALESSLEAHAKSAGKYDLIPYLRDARKAIAKTYTVGRALNDASGTVDARVFGRMYEKGQPLSDGLDVAGKFASAFPSVAKSPQAVGSPAAHNLKAFGAAAMGGGGAMALGPTGVVAAAVPFLAPPVARSIMFRKAAQEGLLRAPSVGSGLLSNSVDELLPYMYRLNPALGISDS